MLTVHKNTREQRKAKELRKQLKDDAKYLSQLKGISGYSIVVWNANCTGDCRWKSTPPVIPGLIVPEFTKQILNRRINTDDTNDIIDTRLF